MSLAELQRDFIDRLLAEPGATPTQVAARVAEGFSVYHYAYRSQLVACLKDSYERLWAWLGDDAFEAAARQHIARHPPHSWTLGDYGAGFAQTLAALYPDDPEVAELGALDWALRRAFDGVDAAAAQPGDLAGVDWEEAAIAFVPTLSMLPVTTNCGALWNAIASGGEVPPASMLPRPAWIRVWRIELQPHFATIEEGEYRAIALAQSGMTFTQLCDRISDETGVAGAVEIAARHLMTWLQDQLIADFPRVATGDRGGQEPSPAV